MSKNQQRLAGRAVAITGGARGIGAATARALVQEGARVAIGDVDDALVQATANALGPNVSGFTLDVTDDQSFESFMDQAELALGPIDTLINNAGIMPVGPFLDETREVAERLVDVNVHGVITGMKVGLRRFVPRSRGHIINIASIAGKQPFPGIATYCGTKYFVVGITEAARLEYRGSGVEFSLVMPNISNTQLGSGISGIRLVPKNEPEDVAAAIVKAMIDRHFDVNIPAVLGPLNALSAASPRLLREAVMRAIGADRALTNVDVRARAAYQSTINPQTPKQSPTEQES